jgi:hypothetical protein
MKQLLMRFMAHAVNHGNFFVPGSAVAGMSAIIIIANKASSARIAFSLIIGIRSNPIFIYVHILRKLKMMPAETLRPLTIKLPALTCSLLRV